MDIGAPACGRLEYIPPETVDIGAGHLPCLPMSFLLSCARCIKCVGDDPFCPFTGDDSDLVCQFASLSMSRPEFCLVDILTNFSRVLCDPENRGPIPRKISVFSHHEEINIFWPLLAKASDTVKAVSAEV